MGRRRSATGLSATSAPPSPRGAGGRVRRPAPPPPGPRAVVSAAGAGVACTSAPFCKFGIFDVKTRGSDLATRLSGTGGSPFLLHASGCRASRAQPQVADIGLRATPLMDEEEAYVEAFDVCAGGNLFGGRLG